MCSNPTWFYVFREMIIDWPTVCVRFVVATQLWTASSIWSFGLVVSSTYVIYKIYHGITLQKVRWSVRVHLWNNNVWKHHYHSVPSFHAYLHNKISCSYRSTWYCMRTTLVYRIQLERRITKQDKKNDYPTYTYPTHSLELSLHCFALWKST